MATAVGALLLGLAAVTLEPSARPPGTEAALRDPCAAFNDLQARVRDGQIPRPEAERQIRALVPLLDQRFDALGGKRSGPEAWVFPLEGYGPEVIGGKGGSGYQPGGYSWFDGERHKGHPAHDLFVYDRDRDNLDDRTGQAIRILSITDGLVVAACPRWEPGDAHRGGIYLAVYDPGSRTLFYYGHCSGLLVRLGEVVAAGQAIGLVGRTGKSAFPARSPTHLHLMALSLASGVPEPVDPYAALCRARRLPTSRGPFARTPGG